MSISDQLKDLSEKYKKACKILDKMLNVIEEAAVYGEHPDELGDDLLEILGIDGERMFEEGEDYTWIKPWGDCE